MRSRATSSSSDYSMSDGDRAVNGQSTPMSSASSVVNEHDFFKRRKLNHSPSNGKVDQRQPVFLKMNFRKGSEVEEPDHKIEDDATYNARPWQEKSTIVPILIAFRARFHDVFVGVPDLGPQDLEEGISNDEPSEDVQLFMCRLLTLAANRAKPVEYPNYNRPLSDIVTMYHGTRGDPSWHGTNPLAGNRRFGDLIPEDRLRLMQCLMEWGLTESKAIRDIIEEAYRNRTAVKGPKLNPYELDVIGRDDKKHGYYLLKGENTRFRLYIQTDLSKSPSRWYSICSTLQELRKLTSDLSDTARTVRCRKIVDDLASIHIPEVERAEDAMTRAVLKRQRVIDERQRRAAYEAEMNEMIIERGSRTRGRRVNYHNMLQGQGEDEDGWNSSRSSPRSTFDMDTSMPHASRSGRTIRKPRAFDDQSPDDATKTSTRDVSIEPGSGTDPAAASPPDDSHIVILGYNKDKFRDREAKSHLDRSEVIETSTEAKQEAIDDSVIPAVSTDTSHNRDVPQQSLVAEQTPRSQTTSTGDTGRGPISESSNAMQNGPRQGTNHMAPTQVYKGNSSTSQAVSPGVTSDIRTNRMDYSRSEKLLLLASVRDATGRVPYLENLIISSVELAARGHVLHLFVKLSTTPEIRTRWAHSDNKAFHAVQKTISMIYLSIAKHAKRLNVELESTVLFEDWSGYVLAHEDTRWFCLTALQSDAHLVRSFEERHRSCFPDHSTPTSIVDDAIVQVGSTDLGQIEIPRKYDTVAVGGTFDHLHAGHKILLTMSAWLANKKLVCGVTDDALLVNKKHKEVMQNLSDRTRSVQIFCNHIKRGIEYEMVPINDVAGPTGNDATIQALVASRETEAGSAQIRQIRIDKALPPLDILFIDVIGPDGTVDGEQMAALKLSSTAIRQKLASKI